MFRIIAIVVFLSALVCAGCISGLSSKATGDEIDIAAVSGPDYREQGTVAYESQEAKLTSSTGCEVLYTYLRPVESSRNVLVVFGHGFMRSKERMAQLARHLASWGIPVVNVEFCNSKWWVGNHDLNGADMVAVARKLNAARGLYTGFSAGGLAALTAAANDVQTIALFGLDLVDNKILGKKLVPELAVPFFGLIAAASICNADRNGLKIYNAISDSKVIEVEDATHCHFEFPFDAKCSLVCGKGEKRFKREIIQKAILGFTTAFLLWQSGIDARGEAWWSEGSDEIKILTQAGYIKILKPQSK